MTTHKNENERPFVVCPRCEGHGTHGPGWVFTQDDLDEQFGHDQFDFMDDMRAGRFDVICSECNGQRVVREDCYCDDCEDEREELAEMEYMERMERAFGC